ncbi:transposase [Lactobacillaceae bacterium 24-114]
MTKYNFEFKAQIVHEHLSTSQSIYDLGEKYDINPKLIAKWVQRYRIEGHNSLKPRHKWTFTADFELNVINYYQTHEESMVEVAARFDILTSQISIWRSQFERHGIKALEPHPKGETIQGEIH